MRSTASIMHLDLDAFFASVEQRDKPSLRGKPVIVGGIGPRGVVATASYEARVHGVRSAMRTAEARARCPHAAFLGGRFEAYRAASRLVMERLREESELVEPLSLDEAFVDLAASPTFDARRASASRWSASGPTSPSCTDGLTASVGVASSKLMAKIASEINKPDGVFVVAPGTEARRARADAGDRHPRRRSGHGRAAAPRGHQHGRGAAATPSEDELVRLLGASARSVAVAPRPGARRPAGGGRAGGEVGERRGHLRARHHRPGAADERWSTAMSRTVADRLRRQRTVRRAPSPSRCGTTTSRRTPGRARCADRPTAPRVLTETARAPARRRRPRRRAPAARRRRQRAGRLGPGRPVRPEPEDDRTRPTRPSRRARARDRRDRCAGTPGRTSITPSTATDGCGVPGWVASPCASRPARPRRDRCTRSPRTTPALSPGHGDSDAPAPDTVEE